MSCNALTTYHDLKTQLLSLKCLYYIGVFGKSGCPNSKINV